MEENMAQHVPDTLPDDVRWGFTRKGLQTLLHYIHPIPLGRGFTQSFVKENWPGLTFSDALNYGKHAGAWIPDERRFPRITVGPLVKELHVLHDGTTRIINFTPEESLEVALAEAPRNRTNADNFASLFVPTKDLADMTEDELTDFLVQVLRGE